MGFGHCRLATCCYSGLHSAIFRRDHLEGARERLECSPRAATAAFSLLADCALVVQRVRDPLEKQSRNSSAYADFSTYFRTTRRSVVYGLLTLEENDRATIVRFAFARIERDRWIFGRRTRFENIFKIEISTGYALRRCLLCSSARLRRLLAAEYRDLKIFAKTTFRDVYVLRFNGNELVRFRGDSTLQRCTVFRENDTPWPRETCSRNVSFHGLDGLTGFC